MNEALFNTQINDIDNLLRQLEVDADRNLRQAPPQNPAATFRDLSYKETWEIYIRNYHYHFLLSDNAVLEFRAQFHPVELHYVFLECPIDAKPYLEFVSEQLQLQGMNLSAKHAGEYYRKEYNDYLTTCDPKDDVTPIRYDYEPSCYSEGLHPASHIHFGHRDEVRIGTRKILRPLSFVLFVLRQKYPQIWTSLWQLENAEILCRNIRESLEEVDNQYFQARDAWEMHLD